MIKVICIGLGNQFSNYLLPVLIQSTKFIKIIMICDIENKLCTNTYDKIKEYYPDVFRTTDYMDAKKYNSDDPLVIISTPPDTHYEIAKYCLEFKYNIYMDKPFATNTNEANILLQLAEKNNRIIVIGTQRRFEKTFQNILSITKKIGQIKKIHIHNHGNFIDMNPQLQESNIFLGNGYHIIDTVNWLVSETYGPDYTIFSVNSITSKWEKNYNNYNYFEAIIIIEIDSKKIPISVSASHFSPPNTVDEAIIITGNNGELHFERKQAPRSQKPGDLFYVFWSDDFNRICKIDLNDDEAKPDRGAPLRQMITKLSINDRGQIKATGRESLKTIQMIEMIKANSIIIGDTK